MDVAHKVEYKIRDLTTRAIILFPDQAQVQRDIKDVPLKPGINEISIIGLSPSVNQQSIKVEGSGAATIVGITTESMSNPERFDDVYPDSDSDSSDSDSDDLDEPDNGLEQPGLLEVKMKLVELGDDLQRAKDVVANADRRIGILDAYCNSLNKREGVDISSVLATYKLERERAEADRTAGRVRERQVVEAKNKASKEQGRLLKLDKKLKKKAKKSQDKINKRKNKKKQQRERLKEQKIKEKTRLRWERIRVWPKEVFLVTIQLEVSSAFTPASSRRGSFSSEVDFVTRSPSRTMDIDEPVSCDLVLTYVTSCAYWTPSYDLQLSTPSNTGSLCFDACLNNTTSETWENCKVTLSTAQTSFGGHNDTVPFLRPWKIKLGAKGAGPEAGTITESALEVIERAMARQKKFNAATTPHRSTMFGLPSNPTLPDFAMPLPPAPNASKLESQDYQMQLMLLEQQNKKRMMMARQEQDGSGNPQALPLVPSTPHPGQAAQMQSQVQQQQLMMQQRMMQQQQQQIQQQQNFVSRAQQQQMQMMPPPPPPPQVSSSATPDQASQMVGDIQFDALGESWSDHQPALDFQESLVEETGLTTTYDLPGRKTLLPKFTASKQRVARVNFSNVSFNHIVVAKYHAAAYLKATLNNNSKWALLRGPGSLTLDGSFMGKVTIPRCSAGDGFTLNLGIDPAIKVLYPRAQVKRSTTGMFSKEDSSVYTRYIKIHNTRANGNKPINLYVYDQVPVSEDDRLRVDLICPKGLTLDGPRLPAGVPGRDNPIHKDWGKGGAILRKDGQISWDVSLNPGKMVKLDLEYSVALPVGEAAEECTKAA